MKMSTHAHVFLVALVALGLTCFCGCSTDEEKYLQSKVEGIAEWLDKNYPDHRVLVLVSGEYDEAVQNSIKLAFEDEMEELCARVITGLPPIKDIKHTQSYSSYLNDIKRQKLTEEGYKIRQQQRNAIDTDDAMALGNSIVNQFNNEIQKQSLGPETPKEKDFLWSEQIAIYLKDQKDISYNDKENFKRKKMEEIYDSFTSKINKEVKSDAYDIVIFWGNSMVQSHKFLATKGGTYDYKLPALAGKRIFGLRPDMSKMFDETNRTSIGWMEEHCDSNLKDSGKNPYSFTILTPADIDYKSKY